MKYRTEFDPESGCYRLILIHADGSESVLTNQWLDVEEATSDMDLIHAWAVSHGAPA